MPARTLVQRIIQHSLDMMEIHKLEIGPKRRERRNVLVSLAFICCYCLLMLLFDSMPLVGYITAYAISAILPFLFGFYWSNNLFTQEDRDKLRREHSVFRFLFADIIFGLFLTFVERGRGTVHTSGEFAKVWVGMIALVAGIWFALIYPPFFLGRFVASRMKE